MKNRTFRIFFGLLVFATACFLLYFSFFMPQFPKAAKQYSVILYQYTDNDWSSLLEGIRQAEEDEGVVVNYVTAPLGGSPENELELVKREVENGADGILLAPADSAAMAEETDRIAGTTPVLTLETGLGTADPDISADNYSMGYLLGSRVADDMERNGETNVYVITEYMQRYSVQQRYEGFLDAMNTKLPKARILEYQRSEGDFSLPVCIANMYSYGSYGSYVVSLDKYCTEALTDVSDALQLDSASRHLLSQRAFGIGNTEKTVRGLDAGKLKGLVYQNEFNMGYQGLQALILKTQNRKSVPDAKIQYYYVTRDTLYDQENQRLLFPLI